MCPGRRAGNAGFFSRICEHSALHLGPRGEALYLQVCAICHGDHRRGLLGPALVDSVLVDPALVGPDFLATSGSGQVATLHTLIATTVPRDRPSSLGAQGALDVTAYLLEVSGLATLRQHAERRGKWPCKRRCVLEHLTE